VEDSDNTGVSTAPPQVSPDEFLTPRQVADTVGLHPAVVRRAIDAGELRAYKLRSRLRIRRSDFERWVERSIVRP
jgi:excisionase family DNA binding protein